MTGPFSNLYRVLLHAARAEAISSAQLPDFLNLEHGGELALLGQEELDISVLEADLRDQIAQHNGASVAQAAWVGSTQAHQRR